MDVDVSGWIVEFLLRQNSVDDQTINNLITVLPLPNNNPRLKKTFILRQLESDIQKGKISERTIEFLEQIEDLDHNEGASEISDAMIAAYCTVAMHCTAKLIEEIPGDKKIKYATAVKRLWSVRVREMEKCGVRLVHDALVGWVHDVEAGVLSVNLCENVVKMFTDLDVVKTVRRYVDEAKEKMGPSFLESACEKVLNDVGLSEAMGFNEVAEFRCALTDADGVGKGNESSRAHEDEVFKCNNQSKGSAPIDDASANCKGNEASKARVPPTHKHVVSKRSRGAKIVDLVETSHDKYDYIPNSEVSKVQEALESSSFELHAAVKDPLPDALCLAKSLKLSTSGENDTHDHVGGNLTSGNDKAPSSSHKRKGKALEADGDDVTIKDQNRRILPSLFERNHTAHTTEWSDSIDNSEEGPPTRPHLPSPQNREVSPLSIYQMEKLARRRKKKKWSVLEEDTLRTGVQKYGKGNWKLILSMYRDIFKDRTEVDLKDKWRNLTH